MWDKLSWKKLLIVRSEILGQFVNTVIANDKYSRRNRENIPQKIQTQLSQKPRTFSGFFIPFLKSALNFEYLGKKVESNS